MRKMNIQNKWEAAFAIGKIYVQNKWGEGVRGRVGVGGGGGLRLQHETCVFKKSEASF